MALIPKFSEFIELTKAVNLAPDDYHAKAETLVLLKQIRALAESGDPIAQYRLAQAFPKNSNSYFSWMQASAKQGFTNAMLELSKSLVLQANPTNLKQAASYLAQILRSNDTYIKSEARVFAATKKELAEEVKRLMSPSSAAKSPIGFFATKAKNLEELPPQSISQQTLK